MFFRDLKVKIKFKKKWSPKLLMFHPLNKTLRNFRTWYILTRE